MEYIINPYISQDLTTLTWWDNAFSKEELDWLQFKAKQSDIISATGGLEPSINLDLRRSKTSWISYSLNEDWLFEKLSNIIANLNANYYQYDITGFGEKLQLANYDSSDKGTYGWHVDVGGGSVSRKLSLSLQLSDPSEYEGGELEIRDGPTPSQILKKRGYICVFPSFIQHRVTPVTQGSRQSLVVWASGPPFR